MIDRTGIVDGNFDAWLAEAAAEPGRAPVRPDLDQPLYPDGTLTGRQAIALFESQLTIRCLDLEARRMRARGEGFYTIANAGHEGNVVLGRLLRPTDPLVLHYRSGALMIERSRQLPGETPIFDICLSYAASSEDPVAGGRHKVWGSRRGWVPPQTSTIASHLPKAVGLAFGLERAGRLDGVERPLPADSIVGCSFGDASLNHSTAQGALNAACWAAHQRLPMPLLFICEDNGLGISVRTPTGWVEAVARRFPKMAYFQADGLDLADAWERSRQAVQHCRTTRRPTFLHLRTVRLLGHAGSDVEMLYRTSREIEAGEALDPVLATARQLVAEGLLTSGEIQAMKRELTERVEAAAKEAAGRPRLTTVSQVLEPLAPYDEEAVEALARAVPQGREDHWGSRLPEARKDRHLGMLLNWALHDALLQYPQALVFGEDVARKGGVYHVTADLEKRFGPRRVFNTLLDEQTILGLALGCAQLGLLPIPEIQYLAYLHNAEDQLRGEACSLQFFSGDQYQNPMVVRIASYGYQRGFGGHFHNDNSIAVLRDIPGLIIASPARGADAVGMLRTSLALAKASGRVVAFLEPIALYHLKDLHEEGDGLWQDSYPAPGEAVPLAEGRLYHPEAEDLTIISFANGLYLSLKAARALKEEGLNARVFDLRWLKPLDEAGILREAARTGRVLVVDEGRPEGGPSEGVMTLIAERLGREVTLARVTGVDCYVPLGDAANLVLPQVADVVAAARQLCAPAPA